MNIDLQSPNNAIRKWMMKIDWRLKQFGSFPENPKKEPKASDGDYRF